VEKSRHSTPPRNFPGQAVILDLLSKAEALREHQSLLAFKLNNMLATGSGGSGYERHNKLSPPDLAKLRRAWREFIEQGGVTADDLRRFLLGETIGNVKFRQRRHLRLVRSTKSAGPRQRSHTDNNAA
jgi:hypothetical protein